MNSRLEQGRSLFVTLLPFAVGIVAVILAAAWIAVSSALLLDDSYDAPSPPSLGSDVMLALCFTFVGLLIAIKRPDNKIGWALLLGGFLGGIVGGFLTSYAELALLARPDLDLPAGGVAAALGAGSWTFLVGGVFGLLLLFPTGDLPSTRWRWPARLVIAGLLLISLGIAVIPRLDPPFRDVENPLALTDDDSYVVVLYPIIAACVLTVIASGINLVRRFRRSTGDEREQYKWLAFAVVILVATWPMAAFVNYGGLTGAFFGVALMLLPISVGIAVLKYHLYEIDIIINRTLVYVPLTSILVGTIAAIDSILQSFAKDVTQAHTTATVALTTMMLVSVLSPLKKKIQAFVDRYIERTDRSATLRALTSQANSVAQVLDTTAFIDRYLLELMAALDLAGARLEGPGTSFEQGKQSALPPTASDAGTDARLILWPKRSGQLAPAPVQARIADAAAVLAEMLRVRTQLSALQAAGARPLEVIGTPLLRESL